MNDKLDQLRRSATDARDAHHAAQHHVADLQARLHELTRPEAISMNVLPDQIRRLHEETKTVRDQLSSAEAHLNDARILADTEAKVLEEANRVLQHPNLAYDDVKPPKVDHDPERLASTREQIASIKSQLGQIERAPPSREEALADLAFQVRNMAEAPSLNEHGRLILPTNAAGLHAWLNPEAIIAKLEQTLSIPDGISQEDKDRQLSALASRLLELERLEESLVCAARAAGTMVPRRHDADPRAVLGVARAQPEEQAA